MFTDIKQPPESMVPLKNPCLKEVLKTRKHISVMKRIVNYGYHCWREFMKYQLLIIDHFLLISYSEIILFIRLL